MLKASLAPAWGIFFSARIYTQNDKLWTAATAAGFRKTSSYLLSGWDSVQPNPWLNSFTDLPRWTSRPPKPFPSSSPPSLATLHDHRISLRLRWVPQTPNSMHFSPAEIVFSPPPKFLSRFAPSSSRADVGKVCVSLHAARSVSLVRGPECFLTFYCASANKVQVVHQLPKLV